MDRLFYALDICEPNFWASYILRVDINHHTRRAVHTARGGCLFVLSHQWVRRSSVNQTCDKGKRKGLFADAASLFPRMSTTVGLLSTISKSPLACWSVSTTTQDKPYTQLVAGAFFVAVASVGRKVIGETCDTGERRRAVCRRGEYFSRHVHDGRTLEHSL